MHTEFPLQPLCSWWLIWSIQDEVKNLNNGGNPGILVLRILIESYPMKTYMTGFIWYLCFG